MTFITLAKAELEKERVQFYFSFTQDAGVMFAGKKLQNGETTSFKAPEYQAIIAWFGFDALAEALYATPAFCKKYRMERTVIIREQLITVLINTIPGFFYKNNDRKWVWTQNTSEVALCLSNEPVMDLIPELAGSGFLGSLNAYQKEQEEIKRAAEYYRAESDGLSSKKLTEAE